MDLQQLAGILQLKQAVSSEAFDSISIDSRTLVAGQCFLALPGEQVDGHDFLGPALARGAVAAIVTKRQPVDIPQLLVSDPVHALTELARYHRAQLQPRVVGLTGSSGKTTVKEMIATILRLQGETYATPGNYNNHLGVPLSILGLSAAHQYAVFELGANHVGEIAHTARLVQPHVGLINNVSAAHLAGFGSLEGVARAKAELYQALPAEGIAVVNLDDDFAAMWLAMLSDRRVVTYSLKHQTADVTAQKIAYHPGERTHFTLRIRGHCAPVVLPIPGRHNVANALAAASLAEACDCPLEQIVSGLDRIQSVAGRMQRCTTTSGAVLFDDTYNANPGSVKAAIDTLAEFKPQTTILVLGEMAELGATAENHHAEVGAYAKAAGIDALYGIGPLTLNACQTFGDNADYFSDQQALIDALAPQLTASVACVVKGSRSARMETIINAFST